MAEETALISWFHHDDARLFTFIGWAPELARSLASAGFFFMGVPGQVVCCGCGATVNFTAADAPLLSYNHRYANSGCSTYRFRLATGPTSSVSLTVGLQRGVGYEIRQLMQNSELQSSDSKRLSTFPEATEVTRFMAHTGFVNNADRHTATCWYCRLPVPNFGMTVNTVKELHEVFSPFCVYTKTHNGDTRLTRVYQHLANDPAFQERLREMKETFDEVDTVNLDDVIASLGE